ncbi:PAS domain-containing sensor histidine kinase [Sulfurospirillum sp. 1612]|uniref:PAS domain-containing sensor histidine kinase n=1 Tax=Sulfurospirillum sp. 1612 TaxID=3094835 RepID=UPI002F93E633
MSNKSRRLYRLHDIEKMLVFFPIFFILLLSIISFLVASFILDFNKNSQLDLISQRAKLQSSYENNKKLLDYVDNNLNKVHTYFKNIEKKLMFNVAQIRGTINGLSAQNNHPTVAQLTPYLESVERQEHIHFVIFEKNTYNVIYGLNTLKNIQKLIFNNYNNPRSLQLTILYISSQGDKSSFYWKNDDTKSIQVNYFELDKKTDWFIGAFSITDNLKKFTAKTLFHAIGKETSTQAHQYFYFYDYNERYFFNIFNQKKWHSIKDVLPKLSPKEAHMIQRINQKQSRENTLFKNFYDFYQYSFGVGIKTKHHQIVDRYLAEKKKIQQVFQHRKTLVGVIILIFTVIFLIASVSFSNFIKKVFSSYNKRFENKNRLLQIWKERYELAIIASNDGLWDINFKTGKIFFSNTWLEMFGYKRGDIDSYDAWLELIHKDDRDNVEKIMSEHKRGLRDHFIAEYRIKTKLNRYRWVLSRGKIFYDEKHQQERLVMMAMNIVDRKRIEKTLDDTWLLMREGDIVLFRWNNDAYLTVTFASESIAKFGYVPDDLLQQSMMYTDIIYKDDLPIVMQSLQEHIANHQEGFSCIYRILKKGTQELRWVFSHAIFIKDDFGNVTALYGYIYDITAIKQSEQELELKVKDEVAKNIAKDKLLVQQNKLAAMGEMIGAIAHQWRQPLNNISLILHFIRDNYDNQKLSHDMISNYIDKGKKQIDYMSHTIDDFRNFYKPSKERATFDLKKTLLAIKEIASSDLDTKAFNIQIDIEEATLCSFENEFKQAILNIISNAKDAISQKLEKDKTFQGIIDIFGRQHHDSYEIIIANNAGAIKEDIMDRMFEPYFTTKFEKQGTGIGLYMTKMIIENSMLGTIEVHNIEEGVEFKVILPTQEES